MVKRHIGLVHDGLKVIHNSCQDDGYIMVYDGWLLVANIMNLMMVIS